MWCLSTAVWCHDDDDDDDDAWTLKCYAQQSIPICQIFCQLKLNYSGHPEVPWWLFLALFNDAFSTDTYIATNDSYVHDELETVS